MFSFLTGQSIQQFSVTYVDPYQVNGLIISLTMTLSWKERWKSCINAEKFMYFLIETYWFLSFFHWYDHEKSIKSDPMWYWLIR